MFFSRQDLPCMYQVSLIGDRFSVKIKKSLLDFCMNQLSSDSRTHYEKLFSEIDTKTSEDGKDLSLIVSLPIIPSPNISKKKIVFLEIKKSQEKLYLIFDFLYWFGAIPIMMDKVKLPEDENILFEDSDQIYLLTLCRGAEGELGSYGVKVEFSKRSVEAFSLNKSTDLSRTRRNISSFSMDLSATSQNQRKSFSSYRAMSIAAHITHHGVPHFTVPGNCACLGANPDRFEEGGEIGPHNLDNATQQILMLIGIVSMYDEFLLDEVNKIKIQHHK